MIEIKDICKRYDRDVLKNINLAIEDGSIVGIVGVNGAGKTTLLKIMSGVIKPNNGQVFYDGMPVFENVECKKQILFMPEDLLYYPTTTPSSLYELYNSFYEIDKESYQENLNEFGVSQGLLSKLSKGLRRQVFLALALAIKPKYLLLDETFDGLDPKAKQLFKQKILKIQEETNMTVIMTSHTLRELEDICDTCVIINHHEIASNGYIDELTSKYHKYNIAFEKGYRKEEFDFEFQSFEGSGKIIQCVTEYDIDTFKKLIRDKNPKLVEESPITLEEYVIIQESRKKTK